MSPHAHWTSLATTNPMGQQHYEVEIQKAMQDAGGGAWEFTASAVGSLRGTFPAALRFPMRLLNRSPTPVAALAGSYRYPKADLLHRFDLRVPPGVRPEVVTVHDLPPLRFDDEGKLPRYSVPSARRAAGVICPSQFAADEVRALCGVKRIWVIPNGLSREFRPVRPLAGEHAAAMGIRGRYVVHAGGATTRKNLAGLAGAWQRLDGRAHRDITLVLCGPPDPRRDALFRGLPRVVMLGRVPLATVAGLMASAAAVVVPSTYEGFGLPALEGMAAGSPVVASFRGALPEVCGNAAELVEPTGEGIALGLDKVLTDAVATQRMVSLGRRRARDFDWETAARLHLDVYREVLAT